VALGKHMDAVIVDHEATAFEAVRWLRENKVRPLTFIPLDRVQAKEPDDRTAALVNRDGSRLRFVRDVLKFDQELEAAVLYAAGTTVISETLDDARDLRCVA
jgi:structural maintenance of chromosome 1